MPVLRNRFHRPEPRVFNASLMVVMASVGMNLSTSVLLTPKDAVSAMLRDTVSDHSLWKASTPLLSLSMRVRSNAAMASGESSHVSREWEKEATPDCLAARLFLLMMTSGRLLADCTGSSGAVVAAVSLVSVWSLTASVMSSTASCMMSVMDEVRLAASSGVSLNSATVRASLFMRFGFMLSPFLWLIDVKAAFGSAPR